MTAKRTLFCMAFGTRVVALSHSSLKKKKKKKLAIPNLALASEGNGLHLNYENQTAHTS